MLFEDIYSNQMGGGRIVGRDFGGVRVFINGRDLALDKLEIRVLLVA